MNSIKHLLIIILLANTTALFARGGDDVGNGGFAYKQSVNILKMAAKALEEKIKVSTLKDISNYPERRIILQDTLGYDDLDKLSKKNQYRGGRKLAMNYIVNPPTVIVLKPYFEAFAGKTDTELEDASLEVQKRLLHEASHIWGYNEDQSEEFAIAFLNNTKEGEERPTNQIDIKSDFCSCINGKSDLINDCDNFCSRMPKTNDPILYLNTILGPDILMNPKLGNLYNWCNVSLDGDTTAPQCFLNATDGLEKVINIPVQINPGSNSLQANIQALSLDKTYILKIVESKTGSNAQSKEFQLRRKTQRLPDDNLGALKISSINQYTCMNYGGRVDTNGDVTRTSYARVFYYFADNQTPPPMPPGRSQIVCHDEQVWPNGDSAMYPRLELIEGINLMWDKSDRRFMSTNNGKIRINQILEERLFNEYGLQTNLNLFKLISFPNRPNTGNSSSINSPLGEMMIPFNDENGKSFCPTHSEYNGNEPLFNLLKDYMDDTEGLYLAEKEAELIQDGTNYKTIYGTMFITQHILNKYAFYVENGVKMKANNEDLHTKTIYYYWPTTNSMDPLIQGNRKLFTVRTAEELSGNVPTGLPGTILTSDKRIGCIPKGTF